MSSHRDSSPQFMQARRLASEVQRMLRPAATGTLALAALMTAGGVSAQSASGTLEEVTVTGTRVQRDGYEAPTPVSVLGVEQLQASPATNLADSVVRVPALSGSVTSHNMASDLSSGQAGANMMNLRGLGTARTLVLLDGKRMVGSALQSGAADVNSIPSALVERVEVVTGGASAAYGSDALSGVVNFILDSDYTGLKANLEGGMAGEGDGENYKASLTGGFGFAGDRAHAIFSIEYNRTNVIAHNNRDWGKTAYQTISNPAYTSANGQPRYLNVRDVGPAVFTDGGLITGCTVPGGGACPLRGTQFIEGGASAPFEFGSLISGPLMVGGDWATSRVDQLPSLTMGIKRSSAYGQVNYELTQNTTAYAEVQWASTRSTNPSQLRPFDTALTITRDNAFIPDDIYQRMVAAGIPSFTLGTSNADLPMMGADHTREFIRYAVGLRGAFELGATTWSWDAYAGRSEQDIQLRAPWSRVTRFYQAAINAVDDGAGNIVCAVNADTNPGNDMPGCVPYNPMGLGVNSADAINYVIRKGRATTTLQQDLYAASVSGEPFSTWAGPVSVAFGAEHRRESVEGWASELDEQNSFFAGNWHATEGSYRVTEGFLETVVPLAKDQAFAQALDLNGAVRWTDYSTSGRVTTWKLGATWQPLDDIRFRVTRSRDIRAPTLGELYNAGVSGTTNVYDALTNATVTTQALTTGNPELAPEEADTTGIGVVLTPSFLPGFAASVDYYSIDIDGAIASLGASEVVNRCNQGVTALCDSVVRNGAGQVSFVYNLPQNILGQKATGYDVEMSYRMGLSSLVSNWQGDLTLRALVTYVDSLESQDVAGTVMGAGVNSPAMAIGGGNALTSPRLRYLFSGTYRLDPATVVLTMRGIGSGVYNRGLLECVTDCPAGNVMTINDNSIDGVTYFDLSMNYQVTDSAQLYAAIENLLDEDPPLIAGRIGTGFIDGQANGSHYDRLGRQFRLGVRLNF